MTPLGSIGFMAPFPPLAPYQLAPWLLGSLAPWLLGSLAPWLLWLLWLLDSLVDWPLWPLQIFVAKVKQKVSWNTFFIFQKQGCRIPGNRAYTFNSFCFSKRWSSSGNKKTERSEIKRRFWQKLNKFLLQYTLAPRLFIHRRISETWLTRLKNNGVYL